MEEKSKSKPMNKLYHIYEIPGVKIGCTTEPENRVAEQGYSDYRVLESHPCIFIASFKERFLQEVSGYTVDRQPYYQSVKNRFKFHKKPGLQTELSNRVKNRYSWKNDRDGASTAAAKGAKANWTPEKREESLINARKAIAKATIAAATTPNRPSLKMCKCEDCGREIKGIGPAKRHANKSGHTFKIIN